ncbi:class I SAM-dependent methyltransferase [Neobacillus pocheonensis]|uniref:class I SAM-dependent methyltransferase n=1 Tax=Neobacillus pocheonensis TaxID=363869 RepID=UPI003D2E5F12
MDSKTKWNDKYKERLKYHKEPVANSRLKDLSAYLKGGTALDLACGLGGNSMFLARLNYLVEAIDISDVAINFVKEQAKRHHLSIHPRVADLTEVKDINFLNSPFDLIVISYYLDRSLYPIVKSLLKEDGYLFMETYFHSQQTENQGVSNLYKLKSNELLAEFGDWQVLFFEENEQEGRQTIFAKFRIDA